PAGRRLPQRRLPVVRPGQALARDRAAHPRPLVPPGRGAGAAARGGLERRAHAQHPVHFEARAGRPAAAVPGHRLGRRAAAGRAPRGRESSGPRARRGAAAELRWPPAPYRAGFTITDATDAASLDTVRAVYDVLDAHGVRVTKTVWVFPPEEPCGIPALPASIQRGVTLADPGYRRYCEHLAARGFEITLHGATAGTNRRATIERAFADLDQSFPRPATYICHAKNADNPYWQEKVVARGPLRWLLSTYARGHRCSGEDPASPYFWGDLCRE